jgi:hypothetical protein
MDESFQNDNVLEQYHLGFECRHRFLPSFPVLPVNNSNKALYYILLEHAKINPTPLAYFFQACSKQKTVK